MASGIVNHSMTNPGNPQRRDVQLLKPLGYIVLQIDAANPGVWPFHCHIAWHVSGGLYFNTMVSRLRRVKLRECIC